MPEASISMLGRKIFSPDLRGVSKVSKLIPLVSVLLYLCKSIQISEYLQQDVYRSALLTISLASLQGSSLPPSQLSHHASLDKEQIVVHLVMKRDKNNQQLLLSSWNFCFIQFPNILYKKGKGKQFSMLTYRLFCWTQHKGMGLSNLFCSKKILNTRLLGKFFFSQCIMLQGYWHFKAIETDWQKEPTYSLVLPLEEKNTA